MWLLTAAVERQSWDKYHAMGQLLPLLVPEATWHSSWLDTCPTPRVGPARPGQLGGEHRCACPAVDCSRNLAADREIPGRCQYCSCSWLEKLICCRCSCSGEQIYEDKECTKWLVDLGEGCDLGAHNLVCIDEYRQLNIYKVENCKEFLFCQDNLVIAYCGLKALLRRSARRLTTILRIKEVA